MDFTNSPDREIVRHLEKNKMEDCCGRFREDQLNRWLSGSGLPTSNPALYRFLAGLLLLTASQDISAQTLKANTVETIKLPATPGHRKINHK